MVSEHRYYTEKKLKGVNFYVFPSILLEGEEYSQLTNDSVIIYAILLKRMQLSISKSEESKDWIDKAGNVYMYFTLKELADSARVSFSTARRSIAQLIESELLIKARQGAGKPDRLYLLQPDTTARKISGDSPQPCECSQRTARVSTKNTPECSQGAPREREKVNNNSVNPPFIPPRETAEKVKERIDYQLFSGDDVRIVDEIVSVLLDVQKYRRKTFRIGTYYRDTQKVKELFAKVDRDAVAHVIQAVSETEKIDNFHSYAISVLYNYLTSPAAGRKPKQRAPRIGFLDCQQRDGKQFDDALRELGLS